RFFLAFQFLDDVVYFSPHLRIEPGSRLVEKQDLGIVDESHGKGQALLLSTRELAVKGIALFFQTEALEQLLRVAPPLVKAGEEAQRFHHAKFVRKRCGLERGTDFMLQFLGVALRIQSADGDAAAI